MLKESCEDRINFHKLIEMVSILIIIIQLSYTVRIPIFWLADLYHSILSYDETNTLTSLSFCNSSCVNSIHYCHYTITPTDSKFDDFFFCIVFNLNNTNVNALIARELTRFACTRSQTMNSKFLIPHSAASCMRY